MNPNNTMMQLSEIAARIKEMRDIMGWSIAELAEKVEFSEERCTVYESGTEFHIITLNHGNGVMRFQCLLDDGSVEQYELTLSISRHQKIYLQIDSVSFVKINE